jgi:hypothetical protein
MSLEILLTLETFTLILILYYSNYINLNEITNVCKFTSCLRLYNELSAFKSYATFNQWHDLSGWLALGPFQQRAILGRTPRRYLHLMN